MSEVALFFGLSSERLRSRALWAGGALALALFLPYEVIDGKAQFTWQLAPELPPAGVVAALAPTLAGLAIVLASRLCRRATSLALVVLAALALAALLIRLGADAAAWEVLPLPESLSDRPTPALLALALTAAGANLAFRPRARRLSRVVLGAALASALLFYAWPARGEAPIATLFRAITMIPDLPIWRLQLGMVILALLALWPLVIPALGLVYAFRPPAREQPILGVVALFGLPVILLMFVYRSLLGAQGGAGVMASLLGVVILTALLTLAASAVEVLGEGLVTPDAELEQAPGWPILRAAAAALAAALTLGAGQWALARPPAKGVAWALSPATKEGDQLFGELLPAWTDARLRWDRNVRQSSSAQAMVEVKGAARELTSAARGLGGAPGGGLGGAFEGLTREADALDLGGRRWYRLIGDVNEASRASGLPYYVDPTVRIRQTDDGLRRHFFALSYRIERVQRFDAGRGELAALHVRQLGHGRDSHQRLGFSRDLQPFALVVLDELEPFEKELTAHATASPPRCTAREAADPDAADGLARCGEVLGRVLASAPGGLLPPLTSTTERHELQHQLDGPHLPLASLVLRRMGAYADEAQARVNRELSAYVAELTTEGASPRLGLVHLVRFGLLGRRGTEHHVAAIAFEALSGREVRDGDGQLDRAALAEVFSELCAEDDATLRARAAKTWAELFGAKLPALAAVRE